MIHQVTYGSMLHAHQLRLVREFSQARRERIDAVRTREQAVKYRRQVKGLLRQCFGPMPERTPLTPKVTGVVDRPTYTIEKVMFQSRPGLWVTANLYIPRAQNGQKKFPAVLGSCGHASDGKAADAYQSYARTLAHQGFVCLIYDPIGQGERHQYLDHGDYCGPTCEHQIAGNTQSLVGEFFGTWRAWDGIRALDYLLSRPEVDKRHVGMTGNSGGGTLTTFVNMLDDRLTMAAASCLGTDYLTNIENELPCDSEQNPPKVISSLLNYADFFIAQAPRPTILLTQSQDFFDLRGMKEIHTDMQRLYGLFGAKDMARIKLGTGQHGYSPELRQAMVRFFREVVGYEATYDEPDAPLESYETLSCTRTGQLSKDGVGKRVHDFTAARARELSRTRKPVADQAMPGLLTGLLKLPKRSGVPHYRVLRAASNHSATMPAGAVARWGVETQEDILSVLYASHDWNSPELGGFRASIPTGKGMTLHLPHVSAVEDINQGLIPETTVKNAHLVLDVRGIGASRSLVCGLATDFFARYEGEFFHAVHYQMMDQSYLGWRVHDVLATLDLLVAQGGSAIHLSGRGLGGFLALFAGALHPAVAKVTLKNMPRSYHELTQTPIQDWPLSVLPWGILEKTDLPQIVRWMKQVGKKVSFVEPWDAQMLPKGK